jgi:hypothetical protein
MPHERRKAQRHPVSFPVTLLKGGQSFPATALNLGVDGMGIRVSGEIREGQVFVVSFRIPGSVADVALFGKLIWRANDVAGLRFFALADDERSALTRWAETQLQSSASS